jgi:hypothetical protein
MRNTTHAGTLLLGLWGILKVQQIILVTLFNLWRLRMPSSYYCTELELVSPNSITDLG